MNINYFHRAALIDNIEYKSKKGKAGKPRYCRYCRAYKV